MIKKKKSSSETDLELWFNSSFSSNGVDYSNFFSDKKDEVGLYETCQWESVLDESAFDWAIKIYERLRMDLEARKVTSWHSEFPRIINCSQCVVERGCCKKRQLMLAMIARILDWLTRYHEELNDLDLGDYEAAALQVGKHGGSHRGLYPAGTYVVYHRSPQIL